MADDAHVDDIPLFIRRVMPNASEVELRNATAVFDEYMAIVWEIFQDDQRKQRDRDSRTS